MLPDASLLIENVSTRSFVVLKVQVEYLSQCRSRDFTRGTLHMPLDVPCKSNRCHGYEARKSNTAICRGGLWTAPTGISRMVNAKIDNAEIFLLCQDHRCRTRRRHELDRLESRFREPRSIVHLAPRVSAFCYKQH